MGAAQPGRRDTDKPASLGTFVLVTVLALLLVATAVVFAVARRPSVAVAANPAYLPQPGRTGTWLGDTDVFTERQYQILAKNYGIVVLNPYYARYDIGEHFAATERLVELNTQVRVYEYYQAMFWDIGNAPRQGHAGWGSYARGFNAAAWYLKDSRGQPIPFKNRGVLRGYLVDLANPEYRAYAINRLVAFMQRAPYAGVAFDSADPISVSYLLTRFKVTVGPGKVAAWNSGLVRLLADAKAALAVLDRTVLFNGVAPAEHRGAGRNRSLLSVTDGASNESFCFEGTPLPAARDRVLFTSLTEDATVMREHPDKILLQFTNYRVDANTMNKKRLGRYCLAGFLMGWVPGSGYWRFASDYEDDLSYQLPEMQLNLGLPTGEYERRGSVLWRSFEHGAVYLNLGERPVTVQPPEGLVPFADGKPGRSTRASQPLTLGATSAALFLSERYLQPRRSQDE